MTYRKRIQTSVELIGAYILAGFWILPLLYAFWAAFHSSSDAMHFDIFSPLTLDNFREAWSQAPFARFSLNTFLLVSFILPGQLLISTLAAYAFVRFKFTGANVAFALVLVQLMITPEILIVQNYVTLSKLSLVDTISGMGLPYIASAFCIFLLRQAFKSIPKELDDAARIDGAGILRIIWNVYVPLSMPTFVAYGLVSVSFHWNNFLWPLIITNSVETRPLTVGLSIFSMSEAGVEWATISAGTLMTTAPLFVAFLIFQRQFIASFMTAGIK